jgi:hypothetical protein
MLICFDRRKAYGMSIIELILDGLSGREFDGPHFAAALLFVAQTFES